MLFPFKHENLRGRRWPVVTLTIIGVNVVVFLATHSWIPEELRESSQLQLHIVLLKTARPEVQTTPAERQLVEAFERGNRQLYDRIRSPDRRMLDAWDMQMHKWDTVQANGEMANLGRQLERFHSDTALGLFAFFPYRVNPWSYLTACFIHVGWFQLILNMWFLWLAGSVLEDLWGRLIYPFVFVISGVLSLFVHAAIFPFGTVPVMGASGPVAAIIGAFLARLPNTRVQLLFAWWPWPPFRYHIFLAPAYGVMPLWLVAQYSWSLLSGSGGGGAYWFPFGSLFFGVATALLLKVTRIESAVERAIEAKVGWTADPRILKASEWIAQNQLGPAIAELQQILWEKPDMIVAHELLLRAHEKKQDLAAQKEDLEKLCCAYDFAGDRDAALFSYDLFLNLGGEKLPKAVWMDLCRYIERRESWERAASEYEKLAACYPNDAVSLAALFLAARIHLKHLNNRADAARLYRVADSWPVFLLNFDPMIRQRLKEAADDLTWIETPCNQEIP